MFDGFYLNKFILGSNAKYNSTDGFSTISLKKFYKYYVHTYVGMYVCMYVWINTNKHNLLKVIGL